MVKLPQLKTQITAVTIYRDGAKIERKGKISLKAGTHKLEVPNLTQYLDKESVRVSGRGHATITSFDAIDKTVEVSGYDKLDELIKHKETLEKQQRQLQRDVTRQNKRMEFFSQVLENSAIEFSRWIPSGECDVERMGSLETLVTTQLEKLQKLQVKTEEALEKVQKDIAIVNREIDKFRSTVSQYAVTHSIMLNIEAHKLSDCEFNITYFVHNAAWTPSYDFILSETETEVTMYTVVRNNTQEDWDGVNLTVSTASKRPATITEPSPYFIQIYTPPPPRPSRKLRAAKLAAPVSGAARDEMYEEQELAAIPEEPTPPMPEMDEITAITMETGGIHVFVLPDPVKVPADGEPHAFRTSHFKLGAERKFFWNAVDFAEAVEVTIIENSETVLLPGKARIYSQDDYLGETYLELIAPNEKVDVGTRFSYDLKVEKKLVAKSTEKAGLTRGSVAREYEYEIIIKNFRNKLSSVKVMDRIPHSDSEIIKVENKKFNPKPIKEELGVLTWELEIPAEGETTITYSFKVEYPRGQTITPPLP